MAKFQGEVGYGESVIDPPNSGIWKQNITEVPAYGDVVRNNLKMEADSSINENLSVGNSISIVMDRYAGEHFSKIKYVRWEGVRWAVTSVVVQPPRLILTLGEIYNGEPYSPPVDP